MENDGVNLTLSKLKKMVLHLHPGDMVSIMDEETGDFFPATVERIYPHIVLFRKKTGIAVSLDYVSAAQVKVINPAGYEARSEEMEIHDMADAFQEAENRK